MENQKTKSSVVAGILGVALGCVGAHDWYRGGKRIIFAIIHTAMCGVGLILMIVGAIFDAKSQGTFSRIFGHQPVGMILGYGGACLLIGASALWGAVEGFILLGKPEQQLAAASNGAAVSAQNSANVATDGPSASHTDASASSSTSNVAQAAPAAPVNMPAPAPHTPMDPKTKRKIFIGCGIGAGVVVVGVAVAVVLAIVFRVDYGETYKIARDLKEKISDIHYSSDCEYVVDYADSSYTTEKKYSGYVDKCTEALTGDNELVDKLANSSAVRKDKEIKAKFDSFKSAYDAAFPAADKLSAGLDILKTYHSFILKKDDLSTDSAEKDYQAAANILINSGNNDLKTYGEGWLEVSLAYSKAYKAYWGTSGSSTDQYNAYRTARDEYYNWDDDNELDLKEISGIDSSGISKMYSEYSKLYEKIVDAYEEHYDGSGECSEYSSGKVHCNL